MRRAGLFLTLQRLSFVCLLYAFAVMRISLLARAAPTPHVPCNSPRSLCIAPPCNPISYPSQGCSLSTKALPELPQADVTHNARPQSRYQKEPNLVYLEPRSFFGSIGHAISHAAHSVAHAAQSVVHHTVSAVKAVHRAVVHTVSKAASTVKHAVSGVASTVHRAVKRVVHTVHSAARRVVNSVKHAVRHVAHTVRGVVRGVAHTVREVGRGIKSTAKFIKKNGPTIAKVGLKVLAGAEGLTGTVAKFIPGAGEPMSKLLKVASKETDMASNMIHAKVPGPWGGVMKAMDVAEDPVGYGLKELHVGGALGNVAKMALG